MTIVSAFGPPESGDSRSRFTRTEPTFDEQLSDHPLQHANTEP